MPTVMRSQRRRHIKSVSKKRMYRITAIWILCIFNFATIECGKSATKVGLAGVAAVSMKLVAI